jgi:hypothetical protein
MTLDARTNFFRSFFSISPRMLFDAPGNRVLVVAGEYLGTNWEQHCPRNPNADKMPPQWQLLPIQNQGRLCDAIPT